MRITEKVKAQIRMAVRRFRRGIRPGIGTKEPTIEATYQWLLEKYYKGWVKQPNGTETWDILPLSQIPSRRQFKYWFKKFLDPVQANRDRLGSINVNLNSRPKPGRAADLEPEPGETIAFDST